jgi:type I restriction enzyme R subunit
VKRILRTYGYSPDLQARATDTVIEQAEILSETLSEGWAEA